MEQKYKTLSENIKFLRDVNKLTQKQLANAIHKSEISIRKYESGNIKIPFSSIALISSVFKIVPIDLFRDEENEYGYDNDLLNEYEKDGVNPNEIALPLLLHNSIDEEEEKKYKLEMIAKFAGMNRSIAETTVFFDLLYSIAWRECDIELGEIFSLFDKMTIENFEEIRNSLTTLSFGHITQLIKKSK